LESWNGLFKINWWKETKMSLSTLHGRYYLMTRLVFKQSRIITWFSILINNNKFGVLVPNKKPEIEEYFYSNLVVVIMEFISIKPN